MSGLNPPSQISGVACNIQRGGGVAKSVINYFHTIIITKYSTTSLTKVTLLCTLQKSQQVLRKDEIMNGYRLYNAIKFKNEKVDKR